MLEPPRPPISHDSVGITNQDKEQQETSQWLEGVMTDTETPCPAHSIEAPSRAPSTITAELASIMRELPVQSDGEALLSYFMNSIGAIYRFFHVPTTWQQLDELYADLNGNKIPSATQLAFFLSIFAGSAFASRGDLDFDSPNLQGRSTLALSQIWLAQAVHLLTRPPVPPSTQALQAFVNLSHLCVQTEGLTGNFGIISMSGLHMARTMKIHQLDTPRYREERRRNGADMVDVEVKRRTWWHLVASDWLLSNVGGPSEGTYFMHPRQMEVFQPSNVEDADIPTGITHVTEESYNLPLSTPTSMTYFLHRIQSAVISREVIDALPPSFFASPGADSSDEIYNTIISLDQKYQQFLKSLPSFFQLTIRQDIGSFNALVKEKPYLQWQRYLINFIIHTQLARLHRPFLIRGSSQPKFAYSRMQCIRSAETVLEIRQFVLGNESISGFSYIIAHFLLAAMILAMDVCYNADEIKVSQRKQEVLRACRIVEEELKSKMAASIQGAENDLDSSSHVMLRSFEKAVKNLRAVLKRNADKSGLQPSEVEILNNLEASGESHRVEIPETQSFPPPPYDDRHDPLEEPQESAVLSVDDLWDEFFTVGPKFNGSDWDVLLLDLDEQMGGGMGAT